MFTLQNADADFETNHLVMKGLPNGPCDRRATAYRCMSGWNCWDAVVGTQL
jgi:hypothetical protein